MRVDEDGVFRRRLTALTSFSAVPGYPLDATIRSAFISLAGGTARNMLSTDADLSIDSLTDAMTDLQTETKIESGQIVSPITSFQLVVPPANEMNAERSWRRAGIPARR